MPAHDLVETEAALDRLLDDLEQVDVVALDTEFHRERTYFPRLALIQIAWDGGVALVDPLAVDPNELRPFLASDRTFVLHAAGQDMEVLAHACGCAPEHVFDTQVAAGFLGYSSPSLAALVQAELGEKVPKGNRLTDWLKRPLTDAQLRYAAADVIHLLELRDLLCRRLTDKGRLDWAEAECRLARANATVERDPEEAWTRLKERRQLKGEALGVLKNVAAWRERRAAARDLPVRSILPDLAIVAIAQRQPKTAGELRSVRGMDRGGVRKNEVDGILGAVRDGRGEKVEPPGPAGVDRSLRAGVSLASAWLNQLARDLEIDSTLLATKSDLEALLRGDADARLAEGWRADLVGAKVRRLVAGEVALAFDGRGGIVLEERSRRPA